MYPAVLGLALIVCVAQEVPSPAPAGELPVSVERIQKELTRLAPQKPLEIPPVFRLTIEGRPMRFRPAWDPLNDTVVPGWVRPKMPIYHYEFLKQVTPEEFRAGTLFAVPLSKLLEPVASRLADEIREALKRRAEERARKEVDEALRQLLEARKKEGKM